MSRPPVLRAVGATAVSDVQQACDNHTHRAVRALVRIIDDDETSSRAVIDACKLLLAYAHGTPVDRVAVAVQSGRPGSDAVHLMSNERLNAHVARIVEAEAMRADDDATDGLIVTD